MARSKPSRNETIVVSTTDPRGAEFTCTHGALRHAQGKHGGAAAVTTAAIETTVRNPDHVYQSNTEEDGQIHERRLPVGERDTPTHSFMQVRSTATTATDSSMQLDMGTAFAVPRQYPGSVVWKKKSRR